jgi:hypothetical protein
LAGNRNSREEEEEDRAQFVKSRVLHTNKRIMGSVSEGRHTRKYVATT